MSCQKCDSGCQSCDQCTKCDSCESCDKNCNGTGCLSSQAFCATSQRAGTFSFGVPTSKDSLFFSRETWNKIITHINNAYTKGTYSLSNKAQSGTGASGIGTSGLAKLSLDTNDFMTAKKFNEVSEALGKLGSAGPGLTVYAVGSEKKPAGDIIYGSYFETLETYANNLLYKTTQCNDCNVACNVKCNTCLKCNVENCGSCDNGCQSDAIQTCCGSCQSSCQCSGQNNQSSSACNKNKENGTGL